MSKPMPSGTGTPSCSVTRMLEFNEHWEVVTVATDSRQGHRLIRRRVAGFHDQLRLLPRAEYFCVRGFRLSLLHLHPHDRLVVIFSSFIPAADLPAGHGEEKAEYRAGVIS